MPMFIFVKLDNTLIVSFAHKKSKTNKHTHTQKKKCILMICSSQHNEQNKFQLDWMKAKFQLKTVWHCHDLEVWSKY